jgi:hypothetical protein
MSTINYSTNTNSHSLQFATAYTMSSKFAISSLILNDFQQWGPLCLTRLHQGATVTQPPQTWTGLPPSELTNYQRESQSHVMPNSQLVSQSWCQAPSGAQDQIYNTARQLRFCQCGDRMCLSFTVVIVSSTCHLHSQFYMLAFY